MQIAIIIQRINQKPGNLQYGSITSHTGTIMAESFRENFNSNLHGGGIEMTLQVAYLNGATPHYS